MQVRFLGGIGRGDKGIKGICVFVFSIKKTFLVRLFMLLNQVDHVIFIVFDTGFGRQVADRIIVDIVLVRSGNHGQSEFQAGESPFHHYKGDAILVVLVIFVFMPPLAWRFYLHWGIDINCSGNGHGELMLVVVSWFRFL